MSDTTEPPQPPEPVYRCTEGHAHRHPYYLPWFVCPYAVICPFCPHQALNASNLRNHHLKTHFKDWDVEEEGRYALLGIRGTQPEEVQTEYFGFYDPPHISKWEAHL
jgi:hypothetical protein